MASGLAVAVSSLSETAGPEGTARSGTHQLLGLFTSKSASRPASTPPEPRWRAHRHPRIEKWPDQFAGVLPRARWLAARAPVRLRLNVRVLFDIFYPACSRNRGRRAGRDRRDRGHRQPRGHRETFNPFVRPRSPASRRLRSVCERPGARRVDRDRARGARLPGDSRSRTVGLTSTTRRRSKREPCPRDARIDQCERPAIRWLTAGRIHGAQLHATAICGFGAHAFDPATGHPGFSTHRLRSGVAANGSADLPPAVGSRVLRWIRQLHLHAAEITQAFPISAVGEYGVSQRLT